jgi:hypothetical protein
MRLDGLSVAAAYLRVWGIIAGVGLLATSTIAGALVGGALLALSGWSWTWRNLPAGDAQRRSDFNLLAFGTRLQASQMTDEAREAREQWLADRWTARGATRPPEDVARFGTSDVTEAALAYGQLAIAAVRRGRVAIAERIACERLIKGRYDKAPEGEGPYRSERPEAAQPVAVPTQDAVHAAVGAAAAVRSVRAGSVGEPARPGMFGRKGVQRVLLILLTMACVGGVFSLVEQREVTAIGARELGRIHPVRGTVVVTCDRIEDLGWTIVDQRGEVTERILIGWVGGHALPIKWDATGALPGLQVTGHLREPRPTDLVLQALADDPKIEAASFEVYLDGHPSSSELPVFVVVAALTLIGWGFYLRRWRRRAA